MKKKLNTEWIRGELGKLTSHFTGVRVEKNIAKLVMMENRPITNIAGHVMGIQIQNLGLGVYLVGLRKLGTGTHTTMVKNWLL